LAHNFEGIFFSLSLVA